MECAAATTDDKGDDKVGGFEADAVNERIVAGGRQLLCNENGCGTGSSYA